jgi:hypothetical protein
MQYRREHLKGRRWSKILLERGKDEHRRCMAWLTKHLPDEHFMYLTVWLPETRRRSRPAEGLIIMVSNLEDFVLARLGLDFSDKELQGKNERWAEIHEERAVSYLSHKWGVDPKRLVMHRAQREVWKAMKRDRARSNK